MRQMRKPALLAVLVISFSTQGCALISESTDHEEQNAALERWKQCQARYDRNHEHFCDGHRRDVLATYPVHMANHVDTMLSNRASAKRVSRLVKAGLEQTASQVDLSASDTVFPTESRAK